MSDKLHSRSSLEQHGDLVAADRHAISAVEDNSEVAAHHRTKHVPQVESFKDFTKITPSLGIEVGLAHILETVWHANGADEGLKLLVGKRKRLVDLACAGSKKVVANPWPIAHRDCIVDEV
jgi:hypothetical protein